MPQIEDRDDVRAMVLRESLVALREKMNSIIDFDVRVDPICEIFGTGGEGTLSHALVADVLTELEEEAGIVEMVEDSGA